MEKKNQHSHAAAVAKALEEVIARPNSAFAYLTLAYRLHRAGRGDEEALVRDIIEKRWGRAERPSAG